MGERVSTFDSLVETAAVNLALLWYTPETGRVPKNTKAIAEVAVSQVLALVNEGGGTLTETECEECRGGGAVETEDEDAVPYGVVCPSCSGSGRQWQIGKLEGVYFDSPVSPQPIKWLRFVPRSEGDGLHVPDSEQGPSDPHPADG